VLGVPEIEETLFMYFGNGVSPDRKFRIHADIISRSKAL
jgi:hypothetical protein